MGRVRVRVDTTAAARLIGRAERACRPPQVTTAVVAATDVYAAGIRVRAPRRSGALAASVSTEVTGGYTAQTGPGTVYGAVQEFGATIRPVRARALRFEVAGQVVFARQVTVPPSPYVRPTFTADTPTAADRFTDRFFAAI